MYINIYIYIYTMIYGILSSIGFMLLLHNTTPNFPSLAPRFSSKVGGARAV